MELRPTTNLRIPKDLLLAVSDNKRGFMYVYNKAYGGPAATFWARLWGSVICPEIVHDKNFGRNAAAAREAGKKIAEHVPSGFTRLRKVDDDPEGPHFVVGLPLFVARSDQFVESITSVMNIFFGKNKPEYDAGQVYEKLSNHPLLQMRNAHVMQAPGDENRLPFKHEYEMNEVLDAAKLDAAADTALGESLISITVEQAGANLVVFANMTIEDYEAAQMSTTEWPQIRNIDMYPLLMQWVRTGFARAPMAAFPISKIAQTLPKSGAIQRRTNEFNLAVDEIGRPMFVPPDLDDTQLYEREYAAAGNRGDHFALLTPDQVADGQISREDMKKVKLPKNKPVLVDWLNAKYSYTLGTGRLHVEDMSRWRPMDVTHAVTICRKGVDIDTWATLLRLANNIGAPTSVNPIDKDFEDGIPGIPEESVPLFRQKFNELHSDPIEYLVLAQRIYEQQHGSTPMYMLNPKSSFGPFRAFGRWLNDVGTAILRNMDAAYQHLTVSGMTSMLPIVMMPLIYGEKFDEYQAKDNTDRQVYTEQGVDPNWEQEPLPLITDRVGRLPHQLKIANIMRGRPKFAILPVQAGGGKTPIIILDLLSFYQHNQAAPYLIMCPSHLVAQYVKELVYFTGGKLNVIAINSYTLGINSLRRITKLIQSAPRNTVVVADYDCLKIRAEDVMYGTTPTTVYPYADILMQFGFQYVALDEAHYLKNDSQRSQSVQRLVLDIPYKRLASGTMAHDSPSDLAIQISMLDPTLFGSRAEFNARFGEEVVGGKVRAWKPGAQAEIMRQISSRVVVAKAMRKEWAGLLPHFVQNVHLVKMTPEQSRVYHEILDTVIKDIEKAAAKANAPKALKKFVQGKTGVDDEGQKLSEGDEEIEAEEMEGLLKPFIARLEQFLAAPNRDKWGASQLEGADAISPKVEAVVALIREHIRRMEIPEDAIIDPRNDVGGLAPKGSKDDGKSRITGKILIFTSYTASAEEIYNNLPPDIKEKFILYVAKDKIEAGARFENDPNILGMIGVENSMNTGLNFQFVSRLIRIEAVWNPGTLEQGQSRIGRPELKRTDDRKYVFFDWIICDHSIDVTKMARLVSKVVAVAKFENPTDEVYQEMEDVPVVSMDLDSIRNLDSLDAKPKEGSDASAYDDPNNPGHTRGLKDYLVGYIHYLKTQREEFDEWRAEHGVPTLTPVPHAKTPADAKLMKYVPYTPGLEVYKEEELGLVRLDEYLREDAMQDLGLMDSDTAEGSGEGPDPKEVADSLRDMMKGVAVHTEFGDGKINRLNADNVNVLLEEGYTVTLRKSAVFVITRPTTSSKDIRNAMLKEIGELAMDTPNDLPIPYSFRQVSPGRQKKNLEAPVVAPATETPQMSVELHITTTNGYLGISYQPIEGNEAATRTLDALGFRVSPQYYFAEMKTWRMLLAQFTLWRDKGFTLLNNKESSPAFKDMMVLMKAGRLKTHGDFYAFAQSAVLRNFYRTEFKPSTDAKGIKPYPIVEDGKAYVALPKRGQTGTMKAIQQKAPGVIWHLSEEHWTCFTMTPGKTSELIKKIMKVMDIANIDQLRKEAAGLKKSRFRDDGNGDV